MSRVGRKPVVIPAGVTVTLKDDNLTVKGPKGELKRQLPPLVTVKVEKGQVTVQRENR